MYYVYCMSEHLFGIPADRSTRPCWGRRCSRGAGCPCRTPAPPRSRSRRHSRRRPLRRARRRSSRTTPRPPGRSSAWPRRAPGGRWRRPGPRSGGSRHTAGTKMNMLNEFEKYCFQFRKDKIFKKVLKNLKERGGKIFLTTLKIFSNHTDTKFVLLLPRSCSRGCAGRAHPRPSTPRCCSAGGRVCRVWPGYQPATLELQTRVNTKVRNHRTFV